MASLTPLSKGLIGMAVVGAMASAVWHLALKERFSATAPTATTSAPPASAVVSPVTPAPGSGQPAPATPPIPSQPPAAATADGGLSPAENAELGRNLMRSGDFTQARTYLERAVNGGDASAACHLGDLTLKGQGGIPASQEAAAKLFQLAQSRGVICFAQGQ